jgi:hypothetical protein
MEGKTISLKKEKVKGAKMQTPGLITATGK